MDTDSIRYFNISNHSIITQFLNDLNFTSDLYTTDVNEYQIITQKFAIVFAILVAAIIFSNFLVIILIILKKLRKDLFYWKVIILSVGDLIVCTTLPFLHIIPFDDWWKSDTTCRMVFNINLVYYLFSGLALVTLCSDFPINLFSTYFRLRRIFHRSIHGLFMVLPFFLTYAVALPIIIQYGIKVEMRESADHKKICVETINEAHPHPSIPIETLAAVISFPSLMIMIASVVMHKRLSKEVNTPANLNRTNQSTDTKNLDTCVLPEKKISNQRDEHIGGVSEPVFSSAGGGDEILSSTYAVTAITTFSIICYVPSVVWVNRTERDYNQDEIYTFLITHYVIITISLIPAAVRSYMWLIDTNVRKAVFSTLNRCK